MEPKRVRSRSKAAATQPEYARLWSSLKLRLGDTACFNQAFVAAYRADDALSLTWHCVPDQVAQFCGLILAFCSL
jgi:hypothetical protein